MLSNIKHIYSETHFTINIKPISVVYGLSAPPGPCAEGVAVSLWRSWELRVSLECDLVEGS